jgi:hypothetical protein
MDYRALLPFCHTLTQEETVQAILDKGSHRKAAKLLNVASTTVDRRINAITLQAEKQGLLGHHKANGTVPAGFYAETSVKRRRDPETGELVVTEDWTKSRLAKGLADQAFKAMIEGFCIDIKPAKPKPFKQTQVVAEELATAIIFGDPHIGMLCHAIETLAEDYDLDKGLADIKAAIDHAVDISPPSIEGWFINVGDLTHANDNTALTQSGNVLDVAARHNQVMRAAGTIIRYCITKMLTKFPTVKVINARGNHDRDAAFAINLMLECVYENEPRVEVFGNDSKFNFFEFGQNLIMVNHGDMINDNRLAGTMVRLGREAWGRTKYHRIWTGHIHHRTKKEHESGALIETFPILPPVDAWHAGSGYGAERGITMMTLHRDYGQVSEYAPSLDMIRAMAGIPLAA